MIEIQTSIQLSVPTIAVCQAGNICLYLPADWEISEALLFCEQELLEALKHRFKILFSDRNFPRNFGMTLDRLSITPNISELPDQKAYFENFLET